MKKLLKQWIKWKKEKRICICPQKDNPDYKNQLLHSVVIHKDDCPEAISIRTDIGQFINWLSKKK